MKKLITAVLAACLVVPVAGSYAAEDAKDKKDAMKKDDAKKGEGMSKDDAKKKKDKGKKDESK